MTLRSLFRRPHERVFRVELTVYQLDSVPALHKLFYIYWRAKRAEPADGRTHAQAVQNGNTIRWNTTMKFEVVIPSEASDPTTLKPSILQVQLRSERHGRWVSSAFTPEGRVDVDLSEVAAVGVLSRNFLVQDSMLNMTLRLMVRVTHHSGDKIFRNRAAPSANRPPLPRDTSLSSMPLHDEDALEELEVSDEASASQVETVSGGMGLSTTKDMTRRPFRQSISLGSSIGSLNFRQPDRPSAGVLPPAGMTPGSSTTTQYPGSLQTSKIVSSKSFSTLDEDRGCDVDLSIDESRRPSRAPSSASGTSVITSTTVPGWSSSNGITGVGGGTGGVNLAGIDTSASSISSVLEGSFPIPEIVQKDLYETFFQKRMRDVWPGTVVNSRVDAAKIVTAVCASVCEKDGIGTVSVSTADLMRGVSP